MRLAFLLVCVSIALSAAPILRLSNSVVGPVTVAVGAPGSTQTLEAFNIGDGSLALTIAVPPSATWLTASVGAPGRCMNQALQLPCYPLQFQLNTASLGQGTYTADVTVNDPRAVDAPQIVTVTVRVGGQEPVSVDRYIAPGSSIDTAIFPGNGALCFSRSCPGISATSQDGGTWLSIVVYQPGTIRFYSSYMIHIGPPPDMATGEYHGTVSVTGSPDDRVIPVTMRVTRQPIAVPSATEVAVRLSQGGPAMTYPFLPYISLANSGMGALKVGDVTGSGSGVSAYNDQGLGIVTVDPGSLPSGTYNGGLVTIQCNAVNCPLQVPVRLEIVPQGPPVIRYQGVVDNVSFSPSYPVAPGDVVVAEGDQLSLRTAGLDGGVRVLVNDVLAYLYYTSFGQIALQVPDSTLPGTAFVQVVRDGVASNTVSVQVAARAPLIAAVTDAAYNRLDAQHPVNAGDPIILWAIGLGSLPIHPTVQFLGGQFVRTVTPAFAGLGGSAVGLYQVNVTVPQDAPPGSILVSLRFPDATSESVTIGVQ